MADQVQDLELDRFTSTKPHFGVPVIDLRNAARVFVHGCLAAPGTDIFLSPDKASAAQLALEANNLSQAAVPVAKTIK
jgi:hypothetical protein